MTGDPRQALQREGFVWQRGALDADALKALAAAVDLRSRPGLRLRVEDLGAALRPLTLAVRAILPQAHAVRVVGFNKRRGINWGVPWHQDRVVAVAEKADVSGWHAWSRKNGVWHCEPTVDFLEQMVFVRVFLDRVSPENGGMQFAAGSHSARRVDGERAERTASEYPIETENAWPGDILVLPMLTLHRSEPSPSEQTRRVFRVDFAAVDPPAPLEWVETISDRVNEV